MFDGDGATVVCGEAMAYYRCHRIVVDPVEFCETAIDRDASVGERQQLLRWMMQIFDRGDVVEQLLRAPPPGG